MDNERTAPMNNTANHHEEHDHNNNNNNNNDGNRRVIDHSQRHSRRRIPRATQSRRRHRPSRISQRAPRNSYLSEEIWNSMVNSSMDITDSTQREGEDTRDQVNNNMDLDMDESPPRVFEGHLWSMVSSNDGGGERQIDNTGLRSVVAANNDYRNNNSNDDDREAATAEATTTAVATSPTTATAATTTTISSITRAATAVDDADVGDRRISPLLQGIGRRRRFTESSGTTSSTSGNDLDDEDDRLRSRRRMNYRMATLNDSVGGETSSAASAAAAAAVGTSSGTSSTTASTVAGNSRQETAAPNTRVSLLENTIRFFQQQRQQERQNLLFGTERNDISRRPHSSNLNDVNRDRISHALIPLEDPPLLVNSEDPFSQRRRNEYFLPIFSGYEAGLPGWRFSTMPTGSTTVGSNSAQSQVRVALQQHSIFNTQLVSACPKILEGFRVACNKTCFIDEAMRHAILRNCKALGAEVYPSYSAQITHFISPFQAGEEYERACSDSKIIVSLQWLDDCISAKSYIEPYKSVVHYPLKSWTGIPEMKNLVVSVTGFVGEERSDLKFLIRSTGATYSGALQRKENTHLLCSMPEGEKYKKALEWKIKVVNARWIFDCVAQWTHLPEVLYQDIYVNR